MHVLLIVCGVLGSFVSLLYFWLIGHWFARVLMFLLLAFVLASLGAILAQKQQEELFLPGLICGLALSWPLAGLPTYYWRHQTRKLNRAIRRDFAPPPKQIEAAQPQRPRMPPSEWVAVCAVPLVVTLGLVWGMHLIP